MTNDVEIVFEKIMSVISKVGKTNGVDIDMTHNKFVSLIKSSLSEAYDIGWNDGYERSSSDSIESQMLDTEENLF